MQPSRISAYRGRVVCLDLVNGVQVVTRIKEVSADGFVTCGELRVFNIQVVQRPNSPQPEGVVQNYPYGQPLYTLPKEVVLEAPHIMMILEPAKEMIDVYTRETSGILPASGGVMDQLQGVDFTKIGK